MTEQKLDRILATEEELIPSSGFLSAVMQRVEDEANAPASIPFPWKRAIPGMVLVGGVFGWGAVAFVRASIPAIKTLVQTPPPHLAATLSPPVIQAAWIAVAVAVSLGSLLLSKRLAGNSGLM